MLLLFDDDEMRRCNATPKGVGLKMGGVCYRLIEEARAQGTGHTIGEMEVSWHVGAC
jgi:hypothetical protein